MIVVTQSLCFNKNELRQGSFKVVCQRCCLYQRKWDSFLGENAVSKKVSENLH